MPRRCWPARGRSDTLFSAVALRPNPRRQAGLDELIKIAVKNRPGIALFNTGAKVLHHLVGM